MCKPCAKLQARRKGRNIHDKHCLRGTAVSMCRAKALIAQSSFGMATWTTEMHPYIAGNGNIVH
jgi:hypothetical protein